MFRTAMFRPAAPLARPAAPLARTFVSRATFVGRLGTAPEKSTTSAGQPYYKYPLAVSKPPKRDANGSKSHTHQPATLTICRGHPRRRRLSVIHPFPLAPSADP